MTLRRTLRPLGAVMAGFYAALVAFWFVALRPEYPALVGVWAVAGAVLGVLALLVPRMEPGPASNLVGSAVLAAVVVAASGSLLVVTGNPVLVMAACIALLGLSFIIVSRIVLLFSFLGALAFWAWARMDWRDDVWSAAGIALCASAMVAFVAQDMRLRLYDRIEDAHRRELAAELQAEEERQRRRESEATSRMLRLAAHELGTPLTSVTIQARMLVQAAANTPSLRSAQVLDRNVTRLNEVLGDILLLMQHEGGGFPLQPKRFDLAALVRQEAAGTSSAPPVVAAPGPADATTVRADPGKISLALRKLLANARERSTEGGVQVTVHRQGGQVVADFADSGPPVPAERRPHLFTPLGMAHDAVESAARSLGLPVAYAIAKEHKGELRYRVDDSGRSIYSISLPAAGEPAPVA